MGSHPPDPHYPGTSERSGQALAEIPLQTEPPRALSPECARWARSSGTLRPQALSAHLLFLTPKGRGSCQRWPPGTAGH